MARKEINISALGLDKNKSPLAERPLAISAEELDHVAEVWRIAGEGNVLTEDEKRQIPLHGQYNDITY